MERGICITSVSEICKYHISNHVLINCATDLWTPDAGNCKNWAHVTSNDLYSWTYQGVPIECDDEYGIWSGSIVIDEDNTSGFFLDGQDHGVVAIYTQHGLDAGDEEQALAVSIDNGFSFRKYKHNPVLAHGNPSFDFRDPKVFWHAKSKKWIMIVAVAAQQTVEIYTSSNLIKWSPASSFTNPFLTDEHPSFECPNLIEMPLIDAVQQTGFPSAESGSLPRSSIWMLTLSSGSGHPGPHGGGSVVRYFPGTFNGTHFEPVDSRTDRLLDFGPDFYATQFWHNTPAASGPVSISWAANLADCDIVPSGDREKWRGMMTLPRTGALMLTKDGDIRYLSGPVGLDAMRGKKIMPRTAAASNYSTSVSYKDVPSGALVIDLKVSLKEPLPHGFFYSKPAPRVAFAFESASKVDTLTCYFTLYPGGPKFSCSTADGDKQMSTPIPKFNGEERLWEVQMVMDHSILEAYLNRGLRVGTMSVWPTKPYEKLEYRIERWNEDVGIVEVAVQELSAPQMS